MEKILEQRVAEYMRQKMHDVQRKKKPTWPIFEQYSFLYE